MAAIDEGNSDNAWVEATFDNSLTCMDDHLGRQHPGSRLIHHVEADASNWKQDPWPSACMETYGCQAPANAPDVKFLRLIAAGERKDGGRRALHPAQNQLSGQAAHWCASPASLHPLFRFTSLAPAQR